MDNVLASMQHRKHRVEWIVLFQFFKGRDLCHSLAEADYMCL